MPQIQKPRLNRIAEDNTDQTGTPSGGRSDEHQYPGGFRPRTPLATTPERCPPTGKPRASAS